MASNLTDRLSRLVKTMRGQARITETNVQEMLREVRMALLEADVALPVVRDFIARVKDKALGPGGRRLAQPRSGAGLHRAQGTRRHHGRGCGRHQPRRSAAGRHPDGRPAGRGQDHHHRQAGQAPDREAQEEGADRLRRRLPPGRHRTAEDGHQAGRRRMVRLDARPEAARHRRGRDRLRQASLLRRAAGRHGRPPGHRRSPDGRDQGSARGAESGRDPVRRRRHAGPGRDQHRQGLQGSPAADRRRS